MNELFPDFTVFRSERMPNIFCCSAESVHPPAAKRNAWVFADLMDFALL